MTGVRLVARRRHRARHRRRAGARRPRHPPSGRAGGRAARDARTARRRPRRLGAPPARRHRRAARSGARALRADRDGARGRTCSPRPTRCAPRCCPPSATTSAARSPPPSPRSAASAPRAPGSRPRTARSCSTTADESLATLSDARHRPARRQPGAGRGARRLARARRRRRRRARRPSTSSRSGPTTSSSPSTPTCPPLQADPVLLQRVLVNVLANAMRHSPPGRRVRVATSRARRHRRDPRRRPRRRGSRPTAATTCSRRSSASATPTTRPDSASASRSRRASPRAWAAHSTPEDTPGGGLTMVVALPVAGIRRRDEEARDEDPRRRRRPAARARAADHPRARTATRSSPRPTAPRPIALAAQAHPDIVLLDLGMPRLDGVQVIQALRGWTTVPIIVVSGRTGSADKVEALDAGADDYVTKPFQIDELLARLRALSRRTARSGRRPGRRVRRRHDRPRREVRDPRRARACTSRPTEWRMLEFLARNPGALVTRQTLLKEIWATEQRHRLRLPAAVHVAAAQEARGRPGATRRICSPSRAWAIGSSWTALAPDGLWRRGAAHYFTLSARSIPIEAPGTGNSVEVMTETVSISRMQPSDAGEILTVQRAAFVSEALIYGDPDMPPLVQTLDGAAGRDRWRRRLGRAPRSSPRRSHPLPRDRRSAADRPHRDRTGSAGRGDRRGAARSGGAELPGTRGGAVHGQPQRGQHPALRTLRLSDRRARRQRRWHGAGVHAQATAQLTLLSVGPHPGRRPGPRQGRDLGRRHHERDHELYPTRLTKSRSSRLTFTGSLACGRCPPPSMIDEVAAGELGERSGCARVLALVERAVDHEHGAAAPPRQMSIGDSIDRSPDGGAAYSPASSSRRRRRIDHSTQSSTCLVECGSGNISPKKNCEKSGQSWRQ